MTHSDGLPDISVVVPAYNGARHIAETISAILGQTHPPREVIVINDGSTDTTASVLAQFENRIISLTQPNAGVQAARNLGIARACSAFIALCDQDDLWRPTYLEHQASLLRARPDIDFSFGNFYYLRNDIADPNDKFSQAPAGYWDITPRLILPEGWVFDGSIAAQTVGFHPIFPSAVVFSKRLIETVGAFDTAMRGLRNEDGEFTLRCLYRARTAAMPEPLVTIRRHEANFSGDQVMVLVDEVRSLQFIKANHAESKPFHGIIDEAIAQRRVAAIDGAFAQGNHALVRTLFADVAWPERTAKLCLKRAVAGLPDRLGQPANTLLQRMAMRR